MFPKRESNNLLQMFCFWSEKLKNHPIASCHLSLVILVIRRFSCLCPLAVLRLSSRSGSDVVKPLLSGGYLRGLELMSSSLCHTHCNTQTTKRKVHSISLCKMRPKEDAVMLRFVQVLAVDCNSLYAPHFTLAKGSCPTRRIR